MKTVECLVAKQGKGEKMTTWTKNLADKHIYLLSKSLSMNETYTLRVSGSPVDIKGEVYLGTDLFIGYLEGNKLTFSLEQASTATSLTFYILSSDAEIKTIKLETGGNPTNYKPATTELLLPLNRDSYMSPAMTYQMNGNILNFDGETVKRVTKDSNGSPIVVSRKGINLVRNGNFANGLSGWSSGGSNTTSLRSDGSCAYFVPLSATFSGSIVASNRIFYDNTHKYYLSLNQKNIGTLYAHTILSVVGSAPVDGRREIIFTPSNSGESGFSFHGRQSGVESFISDIQIIDLTQAYGTGNEPDLAYIKAHPEEFAWTPNPNDLIETVEIKNNLVGDLESLQVSRLLINSLKIYSRNLTDAEMIQNYEIEKERYGM